MTDERWDRLDALAAAALETEGRGLESGRAADYRAAAFAADQLRVACDPDTIRVLVAAARRGARLRDQVQELRDMVPKIDAPAHVRIATLDTVLALIDDAAALHSKDGAS